MTRMNINRELMEKEISNYIGELNYHKKKTKTGENYYINFFGVQGILEVYYNNDGTTTLGVNKGENREEVRKLAEYLKSSHVFSISDTVNQLLKNIEVEQIEEILNWFKIQLKEKLEAEVFKEGVNTRYELRYKDEILVLRHYINKKLQVQGRPFKLYHNLMSYLNGKNLLNLSTKNYK